MRRYRLFSGQRIVPPFIIFFIDTLKTLRNIAIILIPKLGKGHGSY